ncbi:MAG: NAD-dependent DNA ligase LigA [Holosporales bacterium]|jgi:DNA ligase (NAD+)|nr:NAD-dependent DNA ligase LigA [Holosporales bacterium]
MQEHINENNQNYNDRIDKKAAQIRLVQLAKEIAYHDYLYYTLSQPEISDHEYDLLRRENSHLENLYPDLVRSDSPSHRIGSTPQQEFKKVKHQTKMISLEDAFSENEVVVFFDKAYRFLKRQNSDSLDILAELKIDGLSVSLIYENGVLTQGTTRGDGFVGEDVTKNIKTITDIPLIIPKDATHCMKRFEVRGEVYMTKQTLEFLNKQRKLTNEPYFANTRNAASGSLRQLDANVTKERRLRFLAYEIISDEFVTQEDVVSFLNKCGFQTINPVNLCHSLQDAFHYYQEIEKIRENIPYEIDGVVYKINDRSVQKRLGEVGRIPRHSIAHKFKAEQCETIVRDIIFQIGKSGVLTPVALLEPMYLGGALISRATLHNKDEIERLGLRIKDFVILQRAGDVIPQIVRVILNKRPVDAKPIVYPTSCPSCGAQMDEQEMRCLAGSQCKAQAIGQLLHFATTMEINGLGERNIEFLYNTGRICNFVDIFTLKQRNAECRGALVYCDLFQQVGANQTETAPSSFNRRPQQRKHSLVPLEEEDGWGMLSVKKLFNAIDFCKTATLDKFIYALGIPQVGKQTAMLLAQHYQRIESFLECTMTHLLEIDGIGEKTAKDIVLFVKEQRDMIVELVQHVNLKQEKADQLNHTLMFAGKTIVFTGTFLRFSRSEAKAKAISLGAKIGSNVSKNTDIVVVGENAGQKKTEAERIGIRTINEDEWISLTK